MTGPELAGSEAEPAGSAWANRGRRANEDRFDKPGLARIMSGQARLDQGDNQAGPGSVRPGARPGRVSQTRLARARDWLGPGQNGP